jgi:hypothetical protein
VSDEELEDLVGAKKDGNQLWMNVLWPPACDNHHLELAAYSLLEPLRVENSKSGQSGLELRFLGG